MTDAKRPAVQDRTNDVQMRMDFGQHIFLKCALVTAQNGLPFAIGAVGRFPVDSDGFPPQMQVCKKICIETVKPRADIRRFA